MYKSKFEAQFHKKYPRSKYEKLKLKYTIPEEVHNYTADFLFEDENTIVETKGKLTIQDRKKMLLLKQQYPQYKWVFCFQKPHAKLYKGGKMSYKEWAINNGFEVLEMK